MRTTLLDSFRSGMIFADLPQLETPRLLLRRLKHRDARDLYDFGQDPEVSRYCLRDAYKSISEARRYIRYMKSCYRRCEPSGYAIVLKETGHVIGTIGFARFDADHARAEVGYSLARSCWNQGFATEALSAFLAFCFDTLHLHRVESLNATANPASARVMEKCGMRFEGTLRSGFIIHGRYEDVAIHAILENEYRLTVQKPPHP